MERKPAFKNDPFITVSVGLEDFQQISYPLLLDIGFYFD
jgi:hypothetical protein